QQVGHGERAATDVVDRDRALVGAGGGMVDEDHADAAFLDAVQACEVLVGRRDEHAAHPLFGEDEEVALLLGAVAAGVAEDHRVTALARHVLHARGDIGEEGVADVDDGQPDGTAVPGPQAGGGAVPYETEFADGALHPAAGGGGVLLRPVGHVGPGAGRDAGRRGP